MLSLLEASRRLAKCATRPPIALSCAAAGQGPGCAHCIVRGSILNIRSCYEVHDDQVSEICTKTSRGEMIPGAMSSSAVQVIMQAMSTRAKVDHHLPQ